MAIDDKLPESSTFDLSPARRPGLIGDLVADDKFDDPTQPPPGAGMPTSLEYMNIARTVQALAKTAPALVVSVNIPNLGGAPALVKFSAINNNLTAGDLTITRTIGGAAFGDFDVSWPAGTMPDLVAQPVASINGNVLGMCAAARTGDTVRVITGTGSGTSADDLPFTLAVF